VRIICLVVFLSFGSVLSAESASKEHANSVMQVESEKKALLITSKEEIQSGLLTKSSTLLAKKEIAPKPSVAKLSNWPVVLLMLLGIVCLILGLAWFIKRFGGLNMTGGRDMRVLSSVALGARERVALIDIKGQQFLLGVTTQNINHLHTFDEPVVDNGVNGIGAAGKNNTKGFPKSDFSEKLQQLLKTAKPSSDDRV